MDILIQIHIFFQIHLKEQYKYMINAVYILNYL